MPVSYSFRTTFTARSRTRKQFPQARKPVKLSAQARKVITAEQRTRHMAFDTDVEKVWQRNMEACQELAVKHNKPLRRCQDAVFLGSKMVNGSHKVVSKWKAFVAAMVKEVNAGM